MKTVQITFSPTGGTQKVADYMLERWPTKKRARNERTMNCFSEYETPARYHTAPAFLLGLCFFAVLFSPHPGRQSVIFL